MHLAFGRARANGTPTDQIADVLRRNHIQELTACRQTLAIDFNQQLTCNAQTFVDAKAFVQVGVIDQTFPTHRGPRFFKVDPHHNFQGVLVFVAQGLQTSCVIQSCSGVVNRARANDHQQTVVFTGHDVVNLATRL